MKKYRIRPDSPADKIAKALPSILVVTALVAVCLMAGLMNSWELGLL